MFAHGGKHLGLFYRVNTEVRFHIQIQFQHVLGVTRLFRDHGNNLFGYRGFIQRLGRRSRYCRRSGSRYGRRLHRRCGRFRRGRDSCVDGVDFIHKGLRTFHNQIRFYAVAVIVFHAQRILHNFQHRGLLTGNFPQPSLVFGGVRDTRLALLPHFFQKRHADLRAETRRQAQRIFEIIMPAFAQRNPREFGVRFLEVGNRRHQPRAQTMHGNGVFQAGPHGVARKAFGVAHDNVADLIPERMAQGVRLGTGGTAACGRIGFVRDKHHLLGHIPAAQAKIFFRAGY